MSTTELAELIDSKFRELREGSIVTGTIQEIRPQVVLVDIGYKSEGAISISEFEDEEIEVGTKLKSFWNASKTTKASSFFQGKGRP